MNRDHMDTLMREVESLQREHTNATTEKNLLLIQVGKATLAGEDVAELDMLREKFNDADCTIRWSKERLEEVKAKMVGMVNQIHMWEE